MTNYLDLILKDIDKEEKKNPPSNVIELHLTKESKLDKIPINDIKTVLLILEEKFNIIKNIDTNYLRVPKEKDIYFAFKILPPFKEWYRGHIILNKKSSLKNMDFLSIEKVFDLVCDIDETFQLQPYRRITISSLASYKFPRLKDKVGEIDRKIVRKNAVEWLWGNRIIDEYSYIGQNEIAITIDNICKFNKFKQRIMKIYKEKECKESQVKQIDNLVQKDTKLISLPPDTKWEDIAIRFVNGHDVDILVKNKRIEKSDYKKMGFENKKTKHRVPDAQWNLLYKLAKNKGELSWGSFPARSNIKEAGITKGFFGEELDEDNKDNKRNRGFSYKKSADSTKKTKSLLSKGLKACFGIDGDPFFDYKKEKAYKIKINLIPD